MRRVRTGQPETMEKLAQKGRGELQEIEESLVTQENVGK